MERDDALRRNEAAIMNNFIYRAATERAAWRDMTHWGRFRVRGADAAALLHHLTTNDIKGLKIGQGRDAALVSSRARLLDLVTIFRDGDGFLVITAPNRRAMFRPHAEKFIVYRQDIQIEDVSEQTALWGVWGPQAALLLQSLGAQDVLETPLNTVHKGDNGVDFQCARTSRLPASGALLWGRPELAREIMARVQTNDVGSEPETTDAAPLCDSETFNVLRVEAGLPVAGLELIEEINPWEARLDDTISLHKGCYNGQEIVARLNTYQKVKQHLCGLKLSCAAASGRVSLRAATSEGASREAGFITSSVVSPRFGDIALAYVRADFTQPGQTLSAGDEGAPATVVELPFH